MSANLIMEAGEATFSNNVESTVTLSSLHKNTPQITLTCNDDNLNVYVKSLTVSSLTIGVSSPFSGTVHYHAISKL
mgnify:CR=1 FL=1|tara:strand:+ start:336 stop:563 length:228 start_codon:yes stop_codon:yes gene_type:complete